MRRLPVRERRSVDRGTVQAQLLSSEITLFGLPTSKSALICDLMGKAKQYVALPQVANWIRGVIELVHVRKLFARKPGDPRGRPVKSKIGSVGEGQWLNVQRDCTSGKSDGGIVSMRRMNKGKQPGSRGETPAEFVEKSPSAKGNLVQSTVTSTQGLKSASLGLDRVREKATRDKSLQFTNLLHFINYDRLHGAYQALNHKASVGVDDVTWKEYGEGLPERLDTLLDQIHSGRYRAKASKRIWIPKSDGRKRPIGIAALEDKIVQQALVEVLQVIYEEDFLGFSYGARPNRSQHNALDAIYVAITQRKVSLILDADICGFYDNIEHDWLLKFIEHRIADRRVLRLIKKMLKAGVSEAGKWSKTVVGTP